MFTRVVVGWDGAPHSVAALEWAAAQYAESPIEVVHAIGGSNKADEYLSPTGELSADRVQLIDAVERLREQHPGVHLTTHTGHGSAVDTLGEYLRPDTLIVVGAPEHRQGSRWSVASRLAGRHGGGTVAVVPSANVHESATQRRVTVVAGVDGSNESLTAVDIAVDEAKRRGLELELVHAWQVPRGWNPLLSDFADDVGALEEIHRDLLDEAVEYARTLGARPTGRLEIGDPVEALSRIGHRAALVVVASHGSGAVTRFLLGSVSHDLLLDPPSPLMVVTHS